MTQLLECFLRVRNIAELETDWQNEYETKISISYSNIHFFRLTVPQLTRITENLLQIFRILSEKIPYLGSREYATQRQIGIAHLHIHTFMVYKIRKFHPHFPLQDHMKILSANMRGWLCNTFHHPGEFSSDVHEYSSILNYLANSTIPRNHIFEKIYRTFQIHIKYRLEEVIH